MQDEATALASIHKDAWERAVVQEQWGQVQERVARAVHEGKRDEALRYLGDYRARNAALNRRLKSAAVSASLRESEWLERSVHDSFQGADQAGKQNAFSKDKLAKGRKQRRYGSEYEAK